MADNIKISDLSALTAAQNSTIVPVVDGGTTKQMSLSTLQTHLTASFATTTQLSTQISNVNSTINGLDTDDIDEGSTNLYYTNARVDARIADIVEITSSAGVDALQIQNLTSAVKPILNANDVLSGSLTTSSIEDFPTEVSRSAAAAGFGVGGGGGSTAWNDITSKPSGLLSASAQLNRDYLRFNSTDNHVTITSSSSGPLAITLSVNTGSAAGGGGGTDYIESVTFSGTTLTFTGVGNAFSSTVNLSTGDLLDNTDLFGYLVTSVYQTDSASFASRIDGGGGGGSVPSGTVSSSAQTLSHLSGSGVVSSSQQITAANTNLTGLTIDDIGNGSINRYYTDALVKSYLDSIDVISGSVSATMDFSGTNIVSTSTQIENLGFLTNQTFGTATQSLQNQLDAIEGVSVNDENVFLANQIFTQGIIVTGSIRIPSGSGFFSGSGRDLFDIPASAIVGTLANVGNSLSDGDNDIIVDFAQGVTATIGTGDFSVVGANILVGSGSFFSGSGAGLFNIPGSAIIGGVGGGTSIATGSVTASVHPTLGLIVNSDISASGDITARSISVGTSGTPTIFSANNLNLSASNAVVITDSPLRLTPFTNSQTASFTFSEGDLVYSADSDDFYGYRVINGTGSLVSLTAGGSGEVTWVSILGKPNGLISSSAGLVSSSAQILPNGGAGDVLFENTLGLVTSSTEFRYTESTRTLTSPTMSVGVLSYDTLSGPAAATGSFNLVDADRVLINNDYELPTSDGTNNQIIKTNGSGVTSFGNVAWGEISSIPSSIISSSTQLAELNTVFTDLSNDFTNTQVISGSLYVTQSAIIDTLVVTPRHPKPTLAETGSIIVSSSAAGVMRPFFFDGSTWTQMFT